MRSNESAAFAEPISKLSFIVAAILMFPVLSVMADTPVPCGANQFCVVNPVDEFINAVSSTIASSPAVAVVATTLRWFENFVGDS